VTATRQLAAGDILEVYIYQTNDSSASRSLVPQPDYSPKFAVSRIGS